MNKTHQDTALLVMDMQTAVIRNLIDYSELTNKIAQAISFARSINMPVIFVTIQFRFGMPEVSPNNKLFSASKQRSTNMDMSEIMKIDSSLGVMNDDIVITKRRVSAFTGSDLEVILRAKGIQHLVLSGVATSGVVLSTLREAADKDYRITVLSDCCTDSDIAVHELLMNKIFPVDASVEKLATWIFG